MGLAAAAAFARFHDVSDYSNCVFPLISALGLLLVLGHQLALQSQELLMLSVEAGYHAKLAKVFQDQKELHGTVVLRLKEDCGP